VRLYHRTSAQAVEAILAGGFEDRGDFLTRSVRSDGGVWLSDGPLRWHAPWLDATLSVEIPSWVVADFEQPMKSGVREFLGPAEIVNRYGSAAVVDEGSVS
jgi:hypothetical protein